MFEQRDDGPSRRVQRLPGLTGREGLVQPGEDPHRLGGRARRDDDSVAEAQQPTGSLGDRELPRSEPEFTQVISLGSRERRGGQTSFELGDPGLGRAEIGGVAGRSHHAVGRLESGTSDDLCQQGAGVRVLSLGQGRAPPPQSLAQCLDGDSCGHRPCLEFACDQGLRRFDPYGESGGVDEPAVHGLDPVGQSLGLGHRPARPRQPEPGED